MEETHTADIEAGRADPEHRLEESLGLARRVFDTRAAHHGATAVSIFDDQVAAVADVHSATAFGRALAAITDRSSAERELDLDNWSAEAV